ncbi:MAG: IS3 family transposase [Bacteroidota bacterium]|nr:IS3 family transposase [Bacteroidota bacterium]
MSSNFDMDTLCDLFGRSRQAYYQRNKYNYKEEVKEEILLQLVEKQRELMPKVGGRKLLGLIQPRLPTELNVGRDSFFDFLRRHGLLVGKRRRRVKTTYSNHWLHKYPNLIKEFVPTKANQLWVSDITYIETAEGFVYLNLVTDAYSRKIVGWAIGATLEASYTIEAVTMALAQLPRKTEGLIHHSDRGVQYCCHDYVKKLNKNQVQISMTENGDPRENAIAERVNGILKDEWLNQMKLVSLEQAIIELKRIIMIYNYHRPHASLDMRTPEIAHKQSGELKKHWKTYYQKTSKSTS